MKKIRTVIVDDEPLALGLIRSCLIQHPEIDIISECKNGKEAIATVSELEPDLLFLDIQMPGLNGFDVIKRLQSATMPLVVFVTAYQQFALSAFEVNAVDYILKPLDQESLARAVERCKDRLRLEEGRDGLKPQILQAIDQITQQHSDSDSSNVDADNRPQEPVTLPIREQKIVVKDRNSIALIDQADIDWIDAAGDYMCIHVDGVTHIMRSTLKSLLAKLDPDLLKRVHRSTIVNVTRIEKIIPHTKGECFLVLAEDEKIKVSRNYRSVIKNLIEELGAK